MSFKNNRGMTLVEIVVAIGVMGLMATVFASSFAEVFKTQKMVENKDRANDFASTFGQHLITGSNCSEGMTGLKIPAGNSQKSVTLKNYFKYKPAGEQDLGPGTEIENGTLRVKDILISDSGATPKNVFTDGQEMVRHMAKIELKLEIMSKGSWTEVAPRFYEVPVFAMGGTVASCGEEMTKEDACSLIGSSVDPATGRCMPSVNCNFNGHFIKASCSHRSSGCPKDVVNDISGRLACEEPALEKQSGDYSWTYNESCGKKCTRRVRARQQFFICILCESR